MPLDLCLNRLASALVEFTFVWRGIVLKVLRYECCVTSVALQVLY